MPRHKHPPHPDTPSQLPTVEQWGIHEHGVVTFPITFIKFSKVFATHSGSAFYQAKCREDNPLDSFTLDVDANSGAGRDAIWLAVGA